MELFVTESEVREAQEVFERCGLEPQTNRPASSGQPPLVLLNPGANTAPPNAGGRNISRSWPIA